MANTKSTVSFFPTPAIDHAVAGLSAGVVSVLCMHPLDLLKVKYQVAKTPPQGGIGVQMYRSLVEIKQQQGWRGLYRGLGPNVLGNATSWGLYFWFYQSLKNRRTSNDPNFQLSASAYLIASAEASAVTALLTNPIWVVKVRMFTTRHDDPKAYRSFLDGFNSILRTEGFRGLWKGTSLAIFGVSNGAIQFMSYEELKRWGFARKRRQFEETGKLYTVADDRLSNTAYTIMSAGAKLFALASTYPYQVVRSRVQVSMDPNIRECIQRTWKEEGYRGFYRGLGTNLVRVLPGTCITFVVYENLAWLFKKHGAIH